MKKIIAISEIVETVGAGSERLELCAGAEANYDEATERLLVTLDRFLRTADPRRPEKRIDAEWLPGKETLREAVGPGEARQAIQEIFAPWVQKVRQSIPATVHH
jgi:hypothetical protein